MDEQTIEERLLIACQCAYRKHVMNSENIGWTELGEILLNAICEAMGDEEFKKWKESLED